LSLRENIETSKLFVQRRLDSKLSNTVTEDWRELYTGRGRSKDKWTRLWCSVNRATSNSLCGWKKPHTARIEWWVTVIQIFVW